MRTAICMFAFAALLWSDAGVLVPAGHDQPDPSIFSLNEMTVEIRIDNGIARVGSAADLREPQRGIRKALTPSRFRDTPAFRISQSGTTWFGFPA